MPTLACDRCHRMKERCHRNTSNQDCCTRCMRFGHECTIQRVVLKRGRRSRANSHSGSRQFVWLKPQEPVHSKLEVLSSADCILSAGSTPIGFVVSSPYSSLENHLSGPNRLSDEALLTYMRSTEDFSTYFILVPTFSADFKSLGQARFSAFPDLIREGCLACAGAVLQARSQQSGFDDAHFARSAVGLRKLQSRDGWREDVGAFLTLGLTLATFELITSGSSANGVVRFTLSSIRDLYSSIWLDDDLDSEILSLIFMDTIDCLLRRQVPVLRYRPRDCHLVHRLFGLCASLLPIMYEICQLAADARRRCQLPHQLNPILFDHLIELVASWQPQPPADLSSRFSPTEATCLLSQAEGFKTALFLVLHRLQYPLGTEDHAAASLANEILSGCATCSTELGEEGKLPRTLFPWMVAAFEIIAPEERDILLRMELPRSREILRLPTAKLKECVQLVWAMRDAGQAVFLFDILEQAPTYLVPL